MGARTGRLTVSGAWRKRLEAAKDIYEEMYFAPYRSQIYRSYREQRDLFLIMTFSDLLGVPNPAAFYALELYPDLIEEFHQWHLRMAANPTRSCC